jgi:hypothetical protein
MRTLNQLPDGLCDIFIPLLTSGFYNSIYTNQEIGGAYFTKKFIFQIKIDHDPEGFTEGYQAYSLKSAPSGYDGLDLFLNICEAAIQEGDMVLKLKVQGLLIGRFVKSGSFKESELISHVLEEFSDFSDARVNEIFRGFLFNNQVSNANETRQFIRTLYARYEETLMPEINERVEFLLKMFDERGKTSR